eukprot:Pgem_evm1s557
MASNNSTYIYSDNVDATMSFKSSGRNCRNRNSNNKTVEIKYEFDENELEQDFIDFIAEQFDSMTLTPSPIPPYPGETKPCPEYAVDKKIPSYSKFEGEVDYDNVLENNLEATTQTQGQGYCFLQQLLPQSQQPQQLPQLQQPQQLQQLSQPQQLPQQLPQRQPQPQQKTKKPRPRISKVRPQIQAYKPNPAPRIQPYQSSKSKKQLQQQQPQPQPQPQRMQYYPSQLLQQSQTLPRYTLPAPPLSQQHVKQPLLKGEKSFEQITPQQTIEVKHHEYAAPEESHHEYAAPEESYHEYADPSDLVEGLRNTNNNAVYIEKNNKKIHTHFDIHILETRLQSMRKFFQNKTN